jgi:hypothetical protein
MNVMSEYNQLLTRIKKEEEKIVCKESISDSDLDILFTLRRILGDCKSV